MPLLKRVNLHLRGVQAQLTAVVDLKRATTLQLTERLYVISQLEKQSKSFRKFAGESPHLNSQ